MKRRRQKSRGYTLVEIMIVVMILGIVYRLGADLHVQIRRFFFLSNARVTLQREARTAITMMTKNIREAKSSTITVTQLTGQPYYSRLTFTDIDNRNYGFYQSGKNLMMNVGNSTSTLSTNLRYVAFAMPRSDDMGIISVSLTLEKSTYEGRIKALHMASEKVRIMNE